MLVDDHAVFRQGLQTALGDQFRIVGEAVEVGEAVDKAVQLKPDVVIMDVSMPGMNGVAATRGIKERLPDAQVVIVTAKDDDATLLGAIEAGACAFVPKHESLQVLLDAVKQASEGAAYLPPNVTARVMAAAAGVARGEPLPSTRSPLSARETEVLTLLASGMSNREMASALCLSESTIGNCVTQILKKLHVRDRTRATVYAIEHGLVRI